MKLLYPFFITRTKIFEILNSTHSDHLVYIGLWRKSNIEFRNSNKNYEVTKFF